MPFDALTNEPVPPSDLQLLIAARALIGQPHLWLQRDYHTYAGGYYKQCAVMALATACGNSDVRCPTAQEHALARCLVDAMPDRPWRQWLWSARLRVIRYNDRTSTTHHDMMMLFDRAIDQQRQKLVNQLFAS